MADISHLKHSNPAPSAGRRSCHVCPRQTDRQTSQTNPFRHQAHNPFVFTIYKSHYVNCSKRWKILHMLPCKSSRRSCSRHRFRDTLLLPQIVSQVAWSEASFGQKAAATCSSMPCSSTDFPCYFNGNFNRL